MIIDHPTQNTKLNNLVKVVKVKLVLLKICVQIDNLSDISRCFKNKSFHFRLLTVTV